MNLTSFHVVFVGLSVALAFIFGTWALDVYWSATGSVGYLATGVVSVLVAWALAIYLVAFIRKIRRMGLPM